ncbi:MAG: flippase [Candidatus Electryonea clarkiae]|nr:flippase [Candidatus Electryonea clarkiae]MDP8286775.1 flippase [Candidatus Electryonea clarkiae]
MRENRSSVFRIYDEAKRLFEDGDQGRELAKGMAGGFLLKGAAIVLGLGLNILLSRVLGASKYGTYIYAVSTILLLLVPALLGFDRLLVRDISAYSTKSEWGLFRGILRRSHQIVFLFSILLAFLTSLIFFLIEPYLDSFDSNMLTVLWVAMPILPVFAFLRLRQSILQGLGRISLSHAGEMLFYPLLLLIFIIVFLNAGNRPLTAEIALLLNLIALALILIYIWIKSHFSIPNEVLTATPRMLSKRWMKVALPMLAVVSIQVINARVDILMIGAMKGAKIAGIYSAANRGAVLVLIVLFAANAAFAPIIAKHWATGELKRLQSIVKKVTRIGIIVAFPIALALTFFGKYYLLLFGPEFIVGYESLIIMTIGQLVVVAFGSGNIILQMSGNERAAAIGTGISALVNIAMNLILIPRYGMAGAATALVTGQVVSGLIILVMVKKKTGISMMQFKF